MQLTPCLLGLLAIAATTAGCAAPAQPASCGLEGRPSASATPTANLTDTFVASHPPLDGVLQPGGGSRSLSCSEGVSLMDAVAGEGAEVRMLGGAGRDTTVAYRGTTYALTLGQLVA
jgi:hypothetical protein